MIGRLRNAPRNPAAFGACAFALCSVSSPFYTREGDTQHFSYSASPPPLPGVGIEFLAMDVDVFEVS